MRITGLLLIFVATFVQAQQLGRDEFYVLGSGGNTCGKWLEERGYQSLRAQRREWLLGFLTGYNYDTKTSRQVYPQDGQSALAFVDRYCLNNPLSNVGLAAVALVEELGGPKAMHPWKR